MPHGIVIQLFMCVKFDLCGIAACFVTERIKSVRGTK